MSDVNVLNPSGKLVSLPADQVESAVHSGYALATPEDLHNFKQRDEFGGDLNEAKTFLESAAGTASMGLSRHLENHLGLTTPEAQRMRHETNPEAALAGDVAGVAGSLMFGNEATPIKALSKIGHGVSEAAFPAASKLASKIVNPETSPIISKILAKGGAGGLGSAVEGAAFGLGQSINEDALGDPNALGEKLISNVGYGFTIGGGLGVLLGPIGKFGKSATQTALQDEIASTAEASRGLDNPLAGQQSAAPAAEAGISAEASPFTNLPQSLDEVHQAVKDAGPLVRGELPSSSLLRESVDALPDLQFKPHNLQYESLTDQHLRDYYKTYLEGAGDDAKALRDYEGLQKQEGVVKLNSTLEDLSPTRKVNPDPVSAGNKVVDSFVEQYQAEKNELAPAFKEFDKISKGTGADAGNVILKLENAGLGLDANKLIQISEDGKFSLEKYAPDLDISKEAHGALKNLVSTLNKEEVTISQLRNVRESMRDTLSFDTAPRVRSQIEGIRKVIMDEMEERIAQSSGDKGLRETFKRFAQNEEKRITLEKILGGSVSDKASFLKAIKSEDVLDKIFSNTNTVKAAKELLGSKLDQISADWLANKIAKVTDDAKGGFSSNKFASVMKGKAPELVEAFAEKPQVLQRIRALTDYMRILPDSPSVNPSGTAKTLNILERVSVLGKVFNPKQAILDFGEHLASKSEAARQKSTIEKILAGQDLRAAQMSTDAKIGHYSALAKLERAAQNTTQTIQRAAKSIFSGGVTAGRAGAGFIGSKLAPTRADHSKTKDIIAQVEELQNSPEKFIDHLDHITKDVYAFAPNTAQGIQQTMTTAVQFLQSKAPVSIDPKPLAKKLEPSRFELAKFEKYYASVENPLSILTQIKGCTVSPEAMESVKTVYPKLYDEMTQSVLEEMNDHVAKNGAESIPYKTKLGLSMFLGQDLDHTLDQQSIASNQTSLANQAQKQANQGAPNAHHKAGKLTADQSMLTASQAASQRPVS